MGRQVEGTRTSAPKYKFSKAAQRPEAGRDMLYLGKELEFATIGKESTHTYYVSHTTDGLFRSAKDTNSPRFKFSSEARF